MLTLLLVPVWDAWCRVGESGHFLGELVPQDEQRLHHGLVGSMSTGGQYPRRHHSLASASPRLPGMAPHKLRIEETG